MSGAQVREQTYVGTKIDSPQFIEPPRPCAPSLARLLQGVVTIGCAVDVRIPRSSRHDPQFSQFIPQPAKRKAASSQPTIRELAFKQATLQATLKQASSRNGAKDDEKDGEKDGEQTNQPENVFALVEKHLQHHALQQLVCVPVMPKGSSAKAQRDSQYPLFEDTFRVAHKTDAKCTTVAKGTANNEGNAKGNTRDAEVNANVTTDYKGNGNGPNETGAKATERKKSTKRNRAQPQQQQLDRFVRLPRAFGLAAFAGAPGFEGWHARMLSKVAPAPNLRNFVGTLRPYQQEAVDHVVAKMRELPSHSGILQGDCGCGKTLMGFHLMHRFGLPCMVIVHTGVLLEQWLARLGETLPDAKVGVLRADERPAADADVCIAMVHTVIRLSRVAARAYRRYGLLLVDETHIIGARTFSTAVRLVCPPFVLGLSATPKRNDGLHAQVEWLTGPVLFRIDNKSVDVDVQPVRYTDPRFEFAVHECRWDKNRDGKVDSTATISGLVDDPARCAVLVLLAREAVAEGRHTLVLSERVQLLISMEAALGPAACGRIQAGKSKAVLAANELAKTKQVVLASFKMAFVGLDIPQLDTLIFASPLKVREDFKQPIGRIQRGGTGLRARIYDLYDAAGYFLGYFAGHMTYYRQHGYTVLPQRKFERLYPDSCASSSPSLGSCSVGPVADASGPVNAEASEAEAVPANARPVNARPANARPANARPVNARPAPGSLFVECTVVRKQKKIQGTCERTAKGAATNVDDCLVRVKEEKEKGEEKDEEEDEEEDEDEDEDEEGDDIEIEDEDDDASDAAFFAAVGAVVGLDVGASS